MFPVMLVFGSIQLKYPHTESARAIPLPAACSCGLVIKKKEGR